MTEDMTLKVKCGDQLILLNALQGYIDNYTKNISHLSEGDVTRICSQSWIDRAKELKEQMYAWARRDDAKDDQK